jgi:molybdopterin/thiamine biosynthesis adenylyltransferase
LKIVVGREGADKISQLKTFVIGAGAIGCELLKNFAMINMGAKGELLVTDPDHIETSNLSRQFLFREKHVKKAKSATACATLLQLNPRLEGHIVARLDKVCE